jgi:ribosomal protein S18 acetylase RimI-like enzyme
MEVQYQQSPELVNDELNALWTVAWPDHSSRDFRPALGRSLVYLVARDEGKLVGFVNVAWDGGEHGFLLDPTVHPAYRRRGIGSELVRRAAAVARERGLTWLHVDFAPELAAFYDKAGFHRTQAGLMRLRPDG